MPNSEKDFIHALTYSQNDLMGYLVGLLGNLHDAKDVLQATNLVLWEKHKEFRTGAEFRPWARKFAYFQALAFIRDRKRDRHVFDDDVLELLASDYGDVNSAKDDERELALRDCLNQLPEKQRMLIKLRYEEEGSIKQVVDQTGAKASSVKVSLMRIRNELQACIESKIALSNL
ncbi:MAG: sigma-70 family RNA polymerase sigma factor [Verrucomicrobiota bacterium]